MSKDRKRVLGRILAIDEAGMVAGGQTTGVFADSGPTETGSPQAPDTSRYDVDSRPSADSGTALETGIVADTATGADTHPAPPYSDAPIRF